MYFKYTMDVASLENVTILEPKNDNNNVREYGIAIGTQ
jgi:hypothetical protein